MDQKDVPEVDPADPKVLKAYGEGQAWATEQMMIGGSAIAPDVFAAAGHVAISYATLQLGKLPVIVGEIPEDIVATQHMMAAFQAGIEDAFPAYGWRISRASGEPKLVRA